jgi:hypothetical protein
MVSSYPPNTSALSLVLQSFPSREEESTISFAVKLDFFEPSSQLSFHSFFSFIAH